MKLLRRILVPCIILGNSLLTFSEVIYVPGDLSTIQAAVDSASNGDSILVAPGIYYENVQVAQKDDIVIVGSGANITTINGGGNGHVVWFTGSIAVLTGFTITNSGNTMGFHAGVFASQSTVVIEDNIITGNNDGLLLSSNSNITLQRNMIINNLGSRGVKVSGTTGTIQNNLIAYNGSYGIDCDYSNLNIVSNTVIGGNWFGILTEAPDTQIIYNNIIANCRYGITLQLDSIINTPLVKIANNNLWSNDTNYLFSSGYQLFIPTPGNGEIYSDPMFQDFFNNNFQLSSSSPCINAGTSDTTGLNLSTMDLAGNSRISGSSIDIGTYEYQEPVSVLLREQDYYPIVYPNPFAESTYIKFTENGLESDIIKLFDSTGNLVKTKSITGIDLLELRREGLPSGMYFYQLSVNSRVQAVGKIIIQ